MRILVSGASGFIGAQLCIHLKQCGHDVVSLRRGNSSSSEDTIFWNPKEGKAVKEDFEGFDAVVHLAGEPLLGRWSRAKKEKILFSRTASTWLLSNICAQLFHPPKIFLSASAVGYYGNRGEELLDETSAAGRGFLANVCCEWEKATQAIDRRGARSAQMRFGVVCDPKGGILQRLLPLYRLGLGARLGSGNQWISWIALSDLIHAVDFLLHTETLEGPVNFVSPSPIRQKEFSQILAKRVHRPAFFVLPKTLLRIFLGQAADEMILTSVRALPTKLSDAGYSFRYLTLLDALRALD